MRRAGSPAEEGDEQMIHDEDEEFQEPRRVQDVETVGRAEKEEHELLGHVQYRSWCQHCVSARGVGQPHRSVPEDPHDASVPEIVMDYYFLGEENETMPHIVMKDRKSDAYFSSCLDAKGSTYAVAYVTGALQWLGYKRVVIRSDGEPSILSLKRKVIENLPSVECVPKEAPTGDSRAQGAAENAVKQLKGMVRTLKTATEARYGRAIEASNCLLAWMPRHCADLLTRFRKYADGKTAVQRLTGRKWGRPSVVFGESIQLRVAASKPGRRAGLEARMMSGVYVGHHGRSGALMALTEEGMVRARGFRRKPMEERFDPEVLSKIKGVPWELTGEFDIAKYEKPLVAGAMAESLPLAPPMDMPVLPEKKIVRRMYITGADVRRLKGTDGCPACQQVYRTGRTTIRHDEECRRRMTRLLEQEEAGRDRIAKAAKRMARTEESIEEGVESAPMTTDAAGDTEERDAGEASGAPPTSARDEVGSAPEGERKRKASRERPEENEPETPRGTGSKRAGSPALGESPEKSLRVDVDEDVDVGLRLPDSSAGTGTSSALPLRTMRKLSMQKEEVRKSVEERFKQHGECITVASSLDIASLIMDVDGVDLVELYSPKRFRQAAVHLGLRPGIAIDLEVQKSNGEYWDLTREQDVQEMWALLEREDPEYILASPPCTSVSILQNLNRHKRDPARVQEEEAEGRRHLYICVKAFWRQVEKGKFFLHEAPATALSWKDPAIVELMQAEGVQVVQGPMCRWKMQQEQNGEIGYIRKETKWMTNDPHLAQVLAGTCANFQADPRGWHRHILLVGGRARAAQKYPPLLVKAILRSIRSAILSRSSLSAVELMTGGPIADRIEVTEDPEYGEYWDDVNGGYLDPKLTNEARKLELEWVKNEGVYSYITSEEAAKYDKPIPLIWVDTNKGDREKPFIRSRLVVRENKRGRDARPSLDPELLFSAMPPLEALKLMVSLKSTLKRSRRGRDLVLAHFDISRAHFMAKAERDIIVVLPIEDPMRAQGFYGKLERSMYGTQDASRLWQKDYTSLLESAGFRPGIAYPAVFYSRELDARILVHGDDFVGLGDARAMESFHQLLKKKYKVKLMAMIGTGDEVQEATILNRIVRYVPRDASGCASMEIEGDGRHVQVLRAELGLSDPATKGVDTPRVKRNEKQVFEARSSRVLDRAGTRLYRSCTMRIAYLGQDRPDLQEAAKCLSQNMKEPREADLLELKRVARYLVAFPRVVLTYPEQEDPGGLDGWVDSDYAGDVYTRRSTTGQVVMHGKHCIKSSSTVQEPIGLSSGESEFYACVKGAATLLGLRALAEDWHLNVGLKLRIRTDSSAAKGFTTRRGLGRMRHVSTRYLWLQDKVQKQELIMLKVRTEDQPADLLTKAATSKVRAMAFHAIGLELKSGQAQTQKQALV
eukprot:4367367-Amphidinium_carterae.2